MFLADLHIHSTFSDGKLTIPEIVDLYGSQNFGAIAITDHVCESSTVIGKVAHYLGRSLTPATYPLYQEILKSEADRAWQQYRLLVLPGLELSKNTISNSRSAHILAVGVQEMISADSEITDITRAIRAQGGLAIAAHPVPTRHWEKQTYHLWSRREELAPEFDAWEVASGRHLFSEVLETKLPKIANSDFHRRSQMTSWKTVFRCERSAEALMEAVRNQDLSYSYYKEEPNKTYDSNTFLGNMGVIDAYHSLGKLGFPTTI